MTSRQHSHPSSTLPIRLPALVAILLAAGTGQAQTKLPVVDLVGPIYDGAGGGPLVPGKVYVMKQVSGFPPPQKTLTVQKGAIIKVPKGYNVLSGGTLNCDGAIITSFLDDSQGGDSNGDGTKTSPAKGDWGVFQLSGPGSKVSDTVMVYGGGSGRAIQVRTGGIDLDKVTVRDSGGDGIDLTGGRGIGTVSNCKVTDTDGLAYRMGWFEDVGSFVNNSAGNNRLGDYCLCDYGGQMDTMTVTGQNSVNGTGVFVVNANLQAIVVPKDKTLTLAPGLVFKFVGRSSAIQASGNLYADSCTFTCIDDDSVGGDTQKNGPTTTAPGSWTGIRTHKTDGTKAVLTGCTVRFAGGPSKSGGFLVNKDDTVLSGCTSQFCDGPGFRFSSSFRAAQVPMLKNCSSRDNTGIGYSDVPWRTLAQSTGNSSANNAGGNHYQIEVVSVDRNTIVIRRENLPENKVLSLPNGLNVQSYGSLNGSLELPPGTILKFFDNQGLTVGGNGSIRFVGWPDEPIVMTSLHDGQVGGDSNGGSSQQPWPGDWQGANVGSSRPCTLRDVWIRYAGGFGRSLSVYKTVDASAILVEYGSSTGILVQERSSNISNLIVHHCLGDGIQVQGKGYDLEFSSATDNGGAGVRNATGFTGTLKYVNSKDNLGGNFVGFQPTQLHYCNGWATGAQGNIDVSAGFVDQKNGDMRLRPDSKLVDAGRWLSSTNTVRDAFGGSRRADGKLNCQDHPDIGPHELTNAELQVGGDFAPNGQVTIVLKGPAGQGALVIGIPGNSGLHLSPFGFVLVDTRFPFVVLPILPSTILRIRVASDPRLRGLLLAMQGLVVPNGKQCGALTGMVERQIEY